MRNVLWVVMAAALLLPWTVSAEDADLSTVVVKDVNMKIGANLQMDAAFPVQDDSTTNSQFFINRFRLLLGGDILKDKIGYFVQFEGKASPFMLDMKIILKDLIPMTTVTAGRFLTHFTMYEDQSTAKLDIINYPLTTQRYTVGRQVGIQTDTRISDFRLTLGMFNEGASPNNWGDLNDEKDLLARLDWARGFGGATAGLGAYTWMGNKYVSSSVDAEFDAVPFNRVGFYGKYKMAGLRVAAEYLMGQDEYLVSPSLSTDTDTRNSTAMMVQGMYRFKEHYEVLVRFDQHDPNTDIDSNGESWTTAGFNYYWLPEGKVRAMIYLNYIMKTEEGLEVDNDLVQVQLQVAF